MKLQAIVLLFLLLYPTVLLSSSSDVASQGQTELGVNGRVDLDSDENQNTYLKVKAGYYVVNDILVGLQVNLGTEDSGLRESFAPYLELNLGDYWGLSTYVGAQTKFAKSPAGVSDDRIFIPVFYVGAMYVLVKGVAISSQLNIELAQDKVYGESGDRRKTNTQMEIGLRVFL